MSEPTTAGSAANNKKNNSNISYPFFLRVTDAKQALNNVKNNILIVLSWLSLILLQMKYDLPGIASLLTAAVIAAAIFSQVSGIRERIRAASVYIKLYSLITTAGICFFSGSHAAEIHYGTQKFDSAAAMLGVDGALFSEIIFYLLAAFSGISVFIICTLLMQYILDELSFAFSKLTAAEKTVYSALTLLSFAYVIYLFANSCAFWGGPPGYSVLYTSDSSNIVRLNAYLHLTHVENDIRQPLFALFSAPFAGFGYALSLPFIWASSPYAELMSALFMDLVQIVLFLVTVYLAAVSSGLKPAGRICFMLLFSSTYMYLLFSVMMEQYIVCCFWMLFVIYSYIKDGSSKGLYIAASGGTLLTSFALLPLCADAKEIRRFPLLIRKCFDNMLLFVVILLGAGRADIFFGLYQRYTYLSGFMGGKSLAGKACQYTSFVASCFIRPEIAEASLTCKLDYWMLSPDNSVRPDIAGLVIIILCMAGFYLDRKNKFTVISGLWCAFSAVLLILAGWGSAENGMILYSLYFGWAFFSLIFALLKHIADRTGNRYALPVLCGLLILAMGILNYAGISDMFSFAINVYPASA